MRKGFTPLLPHGSAAIRGRGRGRSRGRGGSHSLQRLTVEAPPPAHIKQADEPEAASSDAPPTARPAKPVAKAGRKQLTASPRDGLRHTKQNYEKLAGVKRSRTKAAASRRLVISARRAQTVRRALPRHSDLPASKGRKPPLHRKAPPVPPRNGHSDAEEPEADAKTVLPRAKKTQSLNKQAQPEANNRAQPEAKKAKLEVKKARLKVPPPLEEPATVKAQPQPAEAPKAWKRPESVALATVRGRGSSRGGHLRQGSTRQTSTGAFIFAPLMQSI